MGRSDIEQVITTIKSVKEGGGAYSGGTKGGFINVQVKLKRYLSRICSFKKFPRHSLVPFPNLTKVTITGSSL